MRRGPLSVAAALTLLLPCALRAEEGEEYEGDGAVLAQPFEPVVRPAPAAPLPPVKPPLPRVDLPAYAPVDEPIGDRRPYGLWSGSGAPLELPPDKIGALTPDAPLDESSAPRDAAEQLFVNVELELKQGEELRDAVAGLASGTGFRADARFPPALSPASGSASVWGWLPNGRLTQAAQFPQIRRLSTSRGAHAAPGTAVTEILIGIRVAEGVDPSASVKRAREELRERAGLIWRKTIGYQAVPGSKDIAMIGLAAVPVRSLSRVLAHPDVLRIGAAPGSIPKPSPPPPKPQASPLRFVRFLQFTATESPALLLLTLAVLLPTMVAGARRLSRLL
jgi:hypothetical protein